MGEATATADGHHVVIDGRRWRATDPHIPERLRAELVSELMSARRAVNLGQRAGDDAAVADARRRVHDAKVALGERGEPWWDHPSDAVLAARIAAAMRALLRHRAETSTICPSDAARVAGGTRWRDAMGIARQVAFELHESEILEVRQRGARVDQPADAGGPLRIARGNAFT